MTLLIKPKQKCRPLIDHFKQELKNLRSNRANPGMLDNVLVEVYGSHMRFKTWRTITAPEARQLLITPFDPQTAAIHR